MADGRYLTHGEVKMLIPVYGATINYGEIVVYNNKHNPLQPHDRAMAPNGNIYYAPENPQYYLDFSVADMMSQRTFIHEMGHVFQHQSGVNVTLKGLWQQTKNTLGQDVYNYNKMLDSGVPFHEWSIEAQAQYFGDIWYQREHNKLYGTDDKAFTSLSKLESIAPVRLFPEAARCFPAGTLITLANHTQKPIEHIRHGDIVLSHDKHGNLTPSIVDKLFTNTTDAFIRLSFTDCREDLIATPGHHFLTETGDYMEIGHMARLGGGNVRVVDTDGSIVTAKAERITYSAETAEMFEQAQIKTIAYSGNKPMQEAA